MMQSVRLETADQGHILNLRKKLTRECIYKGFVLHLYRNNASLHQLFEEFCCFPKQTSMAATTSSINTFWLS